MTVRPDGVSPPPRTPRRLAPRPLPLHLASALTTWLGSRAALPLLTSGWPGSKPALDKARAELAARLADVAPEDFAAALDRAVTGEAEAFLRGIETYRNHPYRRSLGEPPVVWAAGTTRLLDYRPAGGAPVFVVPSLINRYHILDLAAETSLLRHLAATGLRPLLVDWGRPGQIERGFSLTDYIAGRLEAALSAALSLAGAPPVILGYCMGGLLALALALRRDREVAALALLATPWDFHAEQAASARLLGSLSELLATLFYPLGELPVDVLQSLFLALDPLTALRKFTRFAGLDPQGAEAEGFVALEDWLNDGVPLALPVARECLGGWYGENTPARGAWRVAGMPVAPRRFARPTLVVLPSRDRIVPPASASALAAALPQAERIAPPLGHIGMIVGRRAPATVWRPLGDWLLRHAPPPRRWTGRRRQL